MYRRRGIDFRLGLEGTTSVFVDWGSPLKEGDLELFGCPVCW